MSKHIRKVLEQSFLLNKSNHDTQIVSVSFADQAEVRSDFDILCNKKGINNPIKIQLTPASYYYPFAPIIQIIVELLKRQGKDFSYISDILSLNLYEKQMIQNIVNRGDTTRNYMMPSDVTFFKSRIRQHIKAAFRHLLSNAEPTVIGITNIEYLGTSSLDFLYEVLKQNAPEYENSFYFNYNLEKKEKSKPKIHNIFTSYENKNEQTLNDRPNAIILMSLSTEGLPSEWYEWENKFEHISTFIRPNDSEFGFDINENEKVWIDENYPYKPIETIHQAIEQCNLLLNFFCCDEVIKICLNWLKYFRTTKLIENEKFTYNEHDPNIDLYHLMGRAQLYKYEYEDALISFDLMYEKAQYQNINDESCKAYIELAYTHIFRSDFESVLHFAEMAAHLGEISMNMRLVAISKFCLFVAYDRSSIKFGFHNIHELIENLERQDLLKEQTYVLRSTFAQQSLDSNITLQIALDFANKAVAIASRNGIKHEHAAANHCRGIVLSMLNRVPDALHAYRLSEDLYESIQAPIELTHVYNSLGFLLNQTEDYQHAHEYYLKALRNSIKLDDYAEITITLYNLATLYQLCGKYKESLHTLNILQDVMTIRGIYNLPFHNVHHILLLKVLVHINLGQENLAEKMLKRSYNLRTTVPQGKPEFFIFNLMQTILYTIHNQKNKALDLFEKVYSQIDTILISHQEHILFYIYAMKIFAHFYCYEKRYKFFKEGLAYALNNQLFYSQKLLINTWNNRENIYDGLSVIEMPITEINQIIPLVNQERKVNVLWKQVHEMRLISMLHSFSLNVETYEQLATETLRLLSSHFNINGGMIYFVNKDTQDIDLISDFNSSKEYPDFSFKKMRDFAKDHISNEIQDFSDISIKNTEIHRLSIYPLVDHDELFGQLLLFTFERKTENHREEFDNINFISQQLSSQLIMMIQRNKLIKVSTTDMLTGLYNRMEFTNRINNCIKKLKPTEDIALGFIDLDNFKYYNDNLGHDVGDKLLVWFSSLLEQIKVKGDVACRWGGDEFLVLMNNCSAHQAQIRMQTILDTLKSKNGYKTEIEEFLGHPIDNLPERYYLSCSIGVMDSSSLPRPFTEADLLNHADQALYEVKRTGKGKVLNYENMTHCADNQIMESNR
ncbi:MAG: tetratricopeptide repeat-containing diguanylate cyclase [Succinivibrionaceae bacterium]|nr:tetratricopeptide repeat-containing diguanylate cyclase [Succinivibrionaceae bacterium]